MGGALSIAAAWLLPACTTSPPAEEKTGEAESAVFVNGDFETGTNNNPPPSWTVTTGINPGVTIQTPQTRAGLNLTNGGIARTFTLVTAAGPESQTDPTLGATASLRWPKFGNACAIVNQQGNNQNANSMRQTMTLSSADVDSVDGLAHVRLVLAPVLQDPGHNADQQPYFFIQLTNITKGNAVVYSDFNFANQAGVPWKQNAAGTVKYTDWALIDIAPGSAQMAPGDQVQLEIIGAGCSLGAHWGQVYVDGIGPSIPGLFVSGTGPAAANQNTDITYTLNYKNGGAAAAGGVFVDFNTPPNTTFTSFNAPGLSCTAPAMGATGLVHCTVGALAAGAGGSFTVTVHINNGTAGSVITAGNYDIFGTGISPLLGPKVYTNVTSGVTYADLNVTATDGVTSVPAGQPVNYTITVTNAGPNAVAGATIADVIPAQLTGVTWTCVGSGGATCTASGSGNINDSATNIPVGGTLTYTLHGTVASGAAAGPMTNLVTATLPVAAVDPNPVNNSAADTDQITVANGVACLTNVDCTSAVCDPADHKCGFANGDGPCTVANGGTVCRSLTCSASSSVCIPAGGCAVDADCAAGSWCNTPTLTCTLKLANGTTVPTVPGHTPALTGTCTAAAAAAVCASGVCDTADNKCGLANNDGPCTVATGGVVCRSGACSVNGTCMPVGGCNADGDCTGGPWCNISAHACTLRLPNGVTLPTDPPHANPTLNGTCTAAAAALVCASGVCDTDNKCGLLNGDGPCTQANGGLTCRSTSCSVNGTCKPLNGCNADGDCAAGNWCNISAHACTPKLANGVALPTDPPHASPTLNGACTAAAAALVCQSGVCDADNKCGLANNDGPCTVANGGTVCRSGVCDGADGKCGLLNGDGACTVANGPALCRSGVCDTDNLCGLAVGDGPCTGATATVVCRSLACSVNGTCMIPGGCNADADCASDSWCNVSLHACAPKIGNGGVMPVDAAHGTPTLDGKCTTPASTVVCVSAVCDADDDRCGYANGDGTCDATSGAVVCRSAVCDLKDSKCGYLNGDGPCTVATGPLVCRSSTCSPNGGVCMPAGGCAVDADCGASEWCNSETFTCKPKLPNGTAIPSVAGHNPALTAVCTAGAGASVCDSGVCDTADNLCGFADGDGPCTALDGIVVCRSGTCSTAGVCEAAGACTVDADCDAVTQYCDTGVKKCAPKLPNGSSLPTVAGHTPNLDGVCSAAEAKVVCQSGVCDPADDKCGYKNGDGPCTVTDAGTVCRSSTCSPGASVCVPSGGCAVDADCAATQWCNTETFACTAKLPNGGAVPTVAGHTPALTGTCTTGAGAAVCASGVCDTNDNKCGYANGDGPCTNADAGTVCREGACTPGGVCTTPADCTVDADCDTAFQYCDNGVGKCAPKVPNGSLMPGVMGHNPVLDGTCSDAAAKVVCLSGVCDPDDDKCGHPIGKGPCDAGNGADVCRSTICAVTGPSAGLCVECTTDTQCAGVKSVCDTDKNACVQCTPAEAAACTGATPVCVPGPDTCAPCNGDLGSNATHACAGSAAPYCFLAGPSAGECGKCTSNADCQGHPGGPFCDTVSGACGTDCHSDGDCAATEWCNAPANGGGTCVPKLDNGTALPGSPPEVKVCTAAVGARVCKSGVCDPKDNVCGLANGDGPCTTDAVCRGGTCDLTTKVCGGIIAGCTKDADCKETEFCATDGACKPKLPDGQACTGDNQCQSDACHAKKCDSLLASGNGVICAARPGGDASGGAGAALLGLMFAAAGLARRRRR